MRTVVITDGKYRATVAAARALGRAGYRVAAVQTRVDSPLTPPVFTSRFVSETRWIDGSAADGDYPGRLMALLEEFGRPILLCGGAATLNVVAARRDAFSAVCDFLLPPFWTSSMTRRPSTAAARSWASPCPGSTRARRTPTRW